jgi:hypothetical protein
MVECAFGILAKKWRIFHRPLDVTPQFYDSMVKAYCILHNFVCRNDGFQLEDTLYESNFESIQATGTRGNIKESTWQTKSSNILRHHTELYLGRTIKYDLEYDIPWKNIDLC